MTRPSRSKAQREKRPVTPPEAMTFKDVMRLLDSVPYCFCTHCKHDPVFGECPFCWCRNKQATDVKGNKGEP